MALGLVYTALNFRKNVPVLGSNFLADLSEIRCVPVAHRSGVLLDITATSSAGGCRLFLSMAVLNGQLLLRPCQTIPGADVFLQIQERCRWALQRAQMLDKTRATATTRNASAHDAAGPPAPTDLLMAPGLVVETTAEERAHITTISQFHIFAASAAVPAVSTAACTATCAAACAATIVAALRRLQDLLYQPDIEARLAPVALYYVRRLCSHNDAGVRAAALDLIGTLSL